MILKPKPPWNVLVFPAASEIGLEICRALGPCKEVVLHGATQSGANIAQFHFHRLHELPHINDPACLPKLQQLIEAEKIDAVFPAHDDVLTWLTERAKDLAIMVLAPSDATTQLCRSKRATYTNLRTIIPVPRLWDTSAPNITFPVFVKPDRGEGSHRAQRIDDHAELQHVLKHEPDLVVMENLQGREYTVDCFSHRDKGLLFAMARSRIQTKSGIAIITQPEPMQLAQEWAEKISRHLNMRGAWFFQMKENAAGEMRLLEIAPRIAGSMAVSRALGPNFPLLTLYEAAGHDLKIDLVHNAGLMMGRSLDVRFLSNEPVDALYVDLDDTLITRGKVNTRLVALIFQCRNQKIPVTLITRDKADLAKTLALHRLAEIFDHIIHIADDETLKAECIAEPHAVLIDDRFRDRSLVAAHSSIRCYDAAGAICLMDDRV